MENLLRDLKLALRALWRNPAFGAAALVTLALGIGGTCAVFSVVNDIFTCLVSKLSWPEPDISMLLLRSVRFSNVTVWPSTL